MIEKEREEEKPFLAPCFTWLIRKGVPYTRLVPRNLCSQSDQHPSKDIWARANRQRRAYTKWHHTGTISEVCAQMRLRGQMLYNNALTLILIEIVHHDWHRHEQLICHENDEPPLRSKFKRTLVNASIINDMITFIDDLIRRQIIKFPIKGGKIDIEIVYVS